MSAPLLFSDEPAPVMVENQSGISPFLILCDHGGKRIPRQLGDLGLPQHEIDRHIGWDCVPTYESFTQRPTGASDIFPTGD